MGLYSTIKSKVAERVIGALLTEIGSIQTDAHGSTFTLSIRQFPGKPPHLSLKFAQPGAMEHFSLPCTREQADLLERAAQEMRKHI